MKKFFKGLIISAVSVIMCAAVFVSGCTTAAVGIESIQKTAEDGNVDTYTIYYSNGSTSTYTVTNGTDGEDGEDGKDGKDGEDSAVTVEALYSYYKEEYGDYLTYSDFLEKYFSNVSTSTEKTDLTDTNSNSVSVKNSCLLSAVSVYSEYAYEYSSGFGPNQSKSTAVTYCTGSGILYEKSEEYCYFVTNYHVVYEYDSSYSIDGIADNIYIYLYGSEGTPEATYASTTSSKVISYDYGGYAIECEYVGGSAASDIAVLRAKTSDVDAINSDFKAVTIADGYHVGETVFTIGNAEGEGLSMTEGIVSVDSEYIYLSVDNTYRYYRSIRIDTALYSGNSGGGLFNEDGELVGLVNAGNTSDQNINYAIPLSIVKGTADNIIYYYEDGDDSTSGAYGVTLGITYTTANSKYVYDTESGYGEITEETVVSEITSDSIAEQIGFKSGDILTEMIITDNDGNTTTYQLTRSFIVTDLLLTLRAGYKISFTYTRDEATGTTSVYTITASDLTERD